MASIPITALYLFGYLSEQFNYARLLAPYITLIQITTTLELLKLLQNKLSAKRAIQYTSAFSICACTILISLVIAETNYLKSATDEQVPARSLPKLLATLPATPSGTHTYEVIADLPASIILPAYGFKTPVIERSSPYFQPNYNRHLKLIQNIYSVESEEEEILNSLSELSKSSYIIFSKENPRIINKVIKIKALLIPIVENEHWIIYEINRKLLEKNRRTTALLSN
jgi:hypothetical protein